MEAIKMNAPAQVNYDATSNSFIAFVDLDRDRSCRALPTGSSPRASPVPVKVEFWGPGDAAANGVNAIDGWDDATPTAASWAGLRSGRLGRPRRRLPAEGQQRQFPRGPGPDARDRQDGAAKVVSGPTPPSS